MVSSSPTKLPQGVLGEEEKKEWNERRENISNSPTKLPQGVRWEEKLARIERKRQKEQQASRKEEYK
jgi:hypothetical protein